METSQHIFANRQTLIVTMAEIKALMSMKDCIDIQKIAFQCNVTGDAVNAPNTWLRPAGQPRWMKLLAGFIGNGTNAMGIKVLARFPKNPPGMNIGSIVALFDPDDGFPLAIMDGVYFTAIRTGAAGGLSAFYSARKGSRSIAVVGSGVQAKFNLLAVRELMPQVKEGFVYSRSPERRESYARDMLAQTGIALKPVPSVNDAVANADIVITATNSPEPVLLKEHLRPGQHIIAVGIKSEIHPAAIAACRIIADGKQTAIEDGKFSLALKAGAVSESDMQVEIGDIIAGKHPGRLNDDEITLFDSSGLAIQDVICAHYVFEKARQAGKGTWVNLGLGELP